MKTEVTVDQLWFCLFTNRAQLPADTSIFQRAGSQVASDKSTATGTVVFFTQFLSEGKTVVLPFIFY